MDREKSGVAKDSVNNEESETPKSDAKEVPVVKQDAAEGVSEQKVEHLDFKEEVTSKTAEEESTNQQTENQELPSQKTGDAVTTDREETLTTDNVAAKENNEENSGSVKKPEVLKPVNEEEVKDQSHHGVESIDNSGKDQEDGEEVFHEASGNWFLSACLLYCRKHLYLGGGGYLFVYILIFSLYSAPDVVNDLLKRIVNLFFFVFFFS